MAKEKLTVGEVKSVVLEYAKLNSRCKKVNDKLSEMKESFYAIMEDYFAELRGKSNTASFEYVNQDGFNGSLEVQRVQSSSVTFDINKLENALGKARCKKAINKTYTINDMAALVLYLKECGADPAIFKSYITIDKTINKTALDKMEEVGELNIKELEGCYELNVNAPYFKVKVKNN